MPYKQSIHRKHESNSYFIQEALANHKKGALHEDLDIPKSEKIPTSLLRKIKNSSVGEEIENPTNVGKKNIKVTRKLKERSVLAYELRGFKHK